MTTDGEQERVDFPCAMTMYSFWTSFLCSMLLICIALVLYMTANMFIDVHKLTEYEDAAAIVDDW